MNKASEAQARYDAEHTARISVKLNLDTDADVIAALKAAKSKQGLIKEAIRNYKKEER